VRLPFVSPVRRHVGIPRRGRAMGYLFSLSGSLFDSRRNARCSDALSRGPFRSPDRGSTQKPRQGEVSS
jgi:hypothetical protein